MFLILTEDLSGQQKLLLSVSLSTASGFQILLVFSRARNNILKLVTSEDPHPIVVSEYCNLLCRDTQINLFHTVGITLIVVDRR